MLDTFKIKIKHTSRSYFQVKTIKVNLGKRSYPIWIDHGLLRLIPELLGPRTGQQWVIVTQTTVRNLYAHKLTEVLKSVGIDVSTIVIPEGEKAKSLSEVESIYEQLLELNCDRSTLLVALGGGVVGDVTGFVAATYLRGVEYLQVPTTLLAMVDSAIGGKTGVNLPQGKNLVGAIYQPIGVVVDPDLLQSLPRRDVISAMGEILKYGAIRDRDFFEKLRQNMDSLLSLKDEEFLLKAIVRCCEIKADVVSHDEQESNLRRILNFGHTVGHALETVAGYGILQHGEAVTYGMIAAGQISHELGYLNQQDHELLISTLRKLPLPKLPDLNLKAVLETIGHDKKVKAGRLHYVVLEGLGNAIITDEVSDEQIMNVIKDGILQR